VDSVGIRQVFLRSALVHAQAANLVAQLSGQRFVGRRIHAHHDAENFCAAPPMARFLIQRGAWLETMPMSDEDVDDVRLYRAERDARTHPEGEPQP